MKKRAVYSIIIIMLVFTKLLLKTAVGLKITNLKAYCA